MSLLKIEAYHEISKSEKLYKDIFKRILKYTDEFLSNHHPPPLLLWQEYIKI